MGTGPVNSESDGQTADAADVNQFRNALVEDFVPRNSSGVAADLAGNMGTTLFRWLAGYFQKIFIGAVASGLSFEEDSGEIIVKVGGSEVARFDSNGLTFDSLNKGYAKGSALNATVSATSYTDFSGATVTITSNGGRIMILLVAQQTPGTSSISVTKTTGSGGANGTLRCLRDGSTEMGRIGFNPIDSTVPLSQTWNSGQVVFWDQPAAGTYTYKLQGICLDTDTDFLLARCHLVAVEL